MGCWNGTCGLSQLPITYDKKIKIVVIKNNINFPEASGFCYSQGYASPFSFIFEGRYNDYGSAYDIIDNEAIKLFRIMFFAYLEEGKIKIEPDKYHDREMNIIDGDYTNISNEELLKIIERDRVYYLTNYYDYETNTLKKSFTNLGLFFVLDEIYENVLNGLLEDEYFNLSNIDKDCQSAVSFLFKNPKFDELSTSDFLQIKSQISTFLSEKLFRNALGLSKILRNELEDSFSSPWQSKQIPKVQKWYNSVYRIAGNQEGSDMKIFDIYHHILLGTFSEEKYDEYVIMLKKFLILLNMISSLRKSWSSQSGKGGQDFDFQVYQGLIDGMQEIINDYRDLNDYDEDKE
jgi:hypothetical protein